MRCRLALPAVLALLALPVGTGCRLGGGSGMTSWLPGQASTASDGEELAAAPPFEGEIVKPSTKATPYPTTSTPQGYVVPGDTETPEATQVVATPPAIDITDPATGRTPPVTYGMKPAEPVTIAGTEAAAGPSAFGGGQQQAPPAESIAAQEGLYGPITPAGQPEAPPQTVASGFSAAGGSSAGLFPPEQEAGLPPPAGETASSPQPGGSAFAGGMPPAAAPPAEAGQPSSAFAAAAPPAGSSFASQPAAPAGGGSAFTSPEAYAAPAATASAFGQPAAVPAGAASDSPVASSRYASAGNSRFGGGAVAEPAAFAATAAQAPADEAAPWQPAPSEVSVEPAPQASAYAAAGSSFASPPAERSFDEPGGAPVAGFGEQPAGFDEQASQPSSPDGGRAKRRPDPMYRPAGTSSYRPSEPIFSDEPTSSGPVQMATFEEQVSLPPQQ